MDLDSYDTGGYFDEYFGKLGRSRPHTEILTQALKKLTHQDLAAHQSAAESILMGAGITFNVYGDANGVEKIFPFDVLPRIVEGNEWDQVEKGLAQRVKALNLFLADIYSKQEIVKAGVIPAEVILSAASYRHQCKGLKPPKGVWAHINGVDLVRDGKGVFHVLEDNLRCPSGVSYVLENREIMKRTFPQIFEGSCVRAVSGYPGELLKLFQSLVPKIKNPRIVVLTPGPANSAYFEHSFLAQQIGAQLVQGHDLVVEGGRLHMKTTKGLVQVDVVYRRIDDDFLDPLEFRPDSMLGVAGIMDVYRKGKVAIVNAPGTGVADDKVVYAYVPKMIEFYLGEQPLLPNVPTYLCWNDDDRAHVLKHLPELVVKSANEAGGYGMLVGPASTKEEQSAFAEKIKQNPRNFIAQPTLKLSRVPVVIEDRLEGRHVDLRPYVLTKPDSVYVLPGGLTRVALKKGSLVVNSSQGGGSKDTWVVDAKAGGKD